MLRFVTLAKFILTVRGGCCSGNLGGDRASKLWPD